MTFPSGKVSVASVSKALNDHDDISKETKEALEKLLKALYDNVLPNAYSLFDGIKTGKEKLNPYFFLVVFL